ncbi:hypothetical protein [Methanobacterium paludis]|nr:hypothetical protein [Methanobacterium paludis]
MAILTDYATGKVVKNAKNPLILSKVSGKYMEICSIRQKNVCLLGNE